MQSSWDGVGGPTTNAWDAYVYAAQAGGQFLDRCNGHVGPRGDYHYHETAGFPYVLGASRAPQARRRRWRRRPPPATCSPSRPRVKGAADGSGSPLSSALKPRQDHFSLVFLE